jgi:hypothetical protein
MRLGLGLKLKHRKSIDEADAFELIGERLLRLPKEIIELLTVVGVAQLALRKSDHGINGIIPDVGQQGSLANLCNKRLESVWNGIF